MQILALRVQERQEFMKRVEFSGLEKKAIVEHIQTYFSAELDHEIGNLGAEMFLDFISEKIGVYYYNRGLTDAQVVVTKKMDDIVEAIFAIEQPVNR